RRKAKSPLQGAIEASNLMWESFGKLREQINALEASLADHERQAEQTNTLKLIQPNQVDGASSQRPKAVSGVKPISNQTTKAEVIQFPRRSS
ncbi:MAG: hypothetical protein R3194_12240, partial [Limnobacter sp.]|nr:hypothetical protein [Limnobacter sp.]